MGDNLEKQEEATPPEEDNSQDKDLDEAKAKRHAEQQAGAKAEVERVKNLAINATVRGGIDSVIEVSKDDPKLALDAAERMVSDDASNLVEIHKKDPKLADKIAKKFLYDDYEDAMKSYKAPNDESQKELKEKKDPKESFDKWYEEKKSEEKHSKALKKVESIFEGIKDEESSKKAKEKFNELIDGKKLTDKQAIEYAEMATLYVNKDSLKNDALNQGIAKFASSSSSKSKASSGGDEMVIFNGKLLPAKSLKNNG